MQVTIGQQLKNIEADEETLPLPLQMILAGRTLETWTDDLFRELGAKSELILPLILIGSQPGLKQSDYAQKLCQDVTTFGRYADRLDRLGHIQRHRSRDDRRAMALHLTASGEALVRSARSRFALIEREMTALVGSDAASRYGATLDQLLGWTVAAQ